MAEVDNRGKETARRTDSDLELSRAVFSEEWVAGSTGTLINIKI